MQLQCMFAQNISKLDDTTNYLRETQSHSKCRSQCSASSQLFRFGFLFVLAGTMVKVHKELTHQMVENYLWRSPRISSSWNSSRTKTILYCPGGRKRWPEVAQQNRKVHTRIWTPGQGGRQVLLPCVPRRHFRPASRGPWSWAKLGENDLWGTSVGWGWWWTTFTDPNPIWYVPARSNVQTRHPTHIAARSVSWLHRIHCIPTSEMELFWWFRNGKYQVGSCPRTLQALVSGKRQECRIAFIHETIATVQEQEIISLV